MLPTIPKTPALKIVRIAGLPRISATSVGAVT